MMIAGYIFSLTGWKIKLRLGAQYSNRKNEKLTEIYLSCIIPTLL